MLTDAQHRAIHTHDRPLLVVAGAGSGKTFVLVNRYLALLEANPTWPLNALVAITFTRKAAQEMQDRVRLELERRYQSAAESLREVWAGRIATMESARITTIHGLCAEILRANAAEAAIDPRFAVLDEVQASILLENTLERCLSAVSRAGQAEAALFSEYSPRLIRDTLKSLLSAELPPLPADPFAIWQAYATTELRQFIAHPLTQALFTTPTPNPADDDLARIFVETQFHLQNITATPDLDAQLQTLATLATFKVGNVGKAAAWGGKETKDSAKTLLMDLRENAKKLAATLGNPQSERRAAELLPLWYTLIQQVQHAYRDAKAQNAQLDFDDLERLTRDVLLKPSVATRYQNAEFKHVLVDEFQDTNAVQWQIIKALTEPHGLFVVGDPKQSIYAFRGADVSVFQQVRGEIGAEIALSTSFRSHARLINAFNDLFARLLVRDEDSPTAAYQIERGEAMHAQRAEAPSTAPSLELLLVNTTEMSKDDDAPAKREWEAEAICQHLLALIGRGQAVYDKATRLVRPAGWGDVALLFQSMSDVTRYEDALKRHGIPFVTVSGRGYYDRQEVWDVLHLLTALHNHADDLALAAALRSPLFNLSDEQLFALRLQRDAEGATPHLWDALALFPADALIAFAQQTLTDLSRLAGRITIADLLREVFARTGYLAVLTGLTDGARRRGNVEKLLDKAESSGQTTLGAFEAYLRDLTEREVREGEALVEVKDAVTLMTVHASKGLEFPIVVIPDSSRKAPSGRAKVAQFDPAIGFGCSIYDHDEGKYQPASTSKRINARNDEREEAERKRRLYVALTRAQDHLIISGQVKQTKQGWSADGWLTQVLEGFELQGLDLTANMPPIAYAWGELAVHLHDTPPELDALTATPAQASAWEHPSVSAGETLHGDSYAPPLLASVPYNPAESIHHLTATQLADLGAAEHDPYYRRKFRGGILHDSPVQIESVQAVPHFQPRIIGEVVHQVLSLSQPPADHHLRDAFRKYAWQQGVVSQSQCDNIAAQAYALYHQCLQTPIHRALSEAQQQYREIPFLYKTAGGRVIHGILDVLFQRADGQWVILDYKTGAVRGYHGEGKSALSQHAHRYHLQMGAYAEAVKAQLGGEMPEVYIHYIRYSQTVRIFPGEWEIALGKLDDQIGSVLSESDWT